VGNDQRINQRKNQRSSVRKIHVISVLNLE
jgi:hypothetical protein